MVVKNKKIIHVSYRLEGGKSVTDIRYYMQVVSFGKVGMSLLFGMLRGRIDPSRENAVQLLHLFSRQSTRHL